MGVIAALIIVVGFGTSLLVWFHFEDKKGVINASLKRPNLLRLGRFYL